MSAPASCDCLRCRLSRCLREWVQEQSCDTVSSEDIFPAFIDVMAQVVAKAEDDRIFPLVCRIEELLRGSVAAHMLASARRPGTGGPLH